MVLVSSLNQKGRCADLAAPLREAFSGRFSCPLPEFSGRLVAIRPVPLRKACRAIDGCPDGFSEEAGGLRSEPDRHARLLQLLGGAGPRRSSLLQHGQLARGIGQEHIVHLIQHLHIAHGDGGLFIGVGVIAGQLNASRRGVLPVP